MNRRSVHSSLPGRARVADTVIVVVRAPDAQPDKKPADKKEPDKKEEPKLPEIKWPTEIGGKDVGAYLKDLEDADPVIREFAARALPSPVLNSDLA